MHVSYLIAAVQLGFPEAVVQTALHVPVRNWTFAARPFDVSHVDEAVVGVLPAVLGSTKSL